ncbi:hypothetical protein [Butyrivibrio fibrisolvens]|uniref:hypothetical protein n=1 Tax=Butyrivibrio fibrisolvens TaxID=831 RepID=UPI0020BF3213|nr:hypothetical protein [Butyrivibrio fibrisolvens]
MAKTYLHIDKEGYSISEDSKNSSMSYKDYLYKKILVVLVDGLVTDGFLNVYDVDSFWDSLSEYRFELFENGIDNGINNEELESKLNNVSDIIESKENNVNEVLLGGIEERIIKVLDTEILPVIMARVNNKDIQLNVDDGFGIIKRLFLDLLKEYGYKVDITRIGSNKDLSRIQVEYEDEIIIDLNDGQGMHMGKCNIASDIEPYIVFKVITNDVEYVNVFFPFFGYSDAIEVRIEHKDGNYLLIVKHDKTGLCVTKKIGG